MSHYGSTIKRRQVDKVMIKTNHIRGNVGVHLENISSMELLVNKFRIREIGNILQGNTIKCMFSTVLYSCSSPNKMFINEQNILVNHERVKCVNIFHSVC